MRNNRIRNPIYGGKIVVPKYQDEEEYTVRGQHEPIITESLFYEVQDVLNGKKRFKEKTRTKIVSLDMLPLHGFLRCPKCTRMLSGSASKGCGGYYYYYHCSASCRVRFRAVDRSEEHTSELQSLMRISYAVFCLKKKKT